MFFVLLGRRVPSAGTSSPLLDASLSEEASSGGRSAAWSLALQWISKDRAPEALGRLIAVGSFASIIAFALVWLAFDIWGVVSDGIGIAYWAHIGGLAGGVGLGLLFLEMGWIKLTEYDNRSLLDIIRREHPV